MNKNNQKQDGSWRQIIEVGSYSLMPFAGYVILGFSLVDFLHILIPLRLTNPVWEFQIIGRLVGQVWAPLLGLIFIFSHREYVGKSELNLLRIISWFSLLLGLFYLLLLPLGVGNTLRIHNSRNLQISAQISQQLEQLEQAKYRIERANNPAEIANLARSFNPQSPVPQIENPQEFKDELLSQLDRVEQNVRTQAVAARQNQKNALLKDSLKFNFGAILAGIAFIGVWVQTRWARQSYLMARRDD